MTSCTSILFYGSLDFADDIRVHVLTGYIYGLNGDFEVHPSQHWSSCIHCLRPVGMLMEPTVVVWTCRYQGIATMISVQF